MSTKKQKKNDVHFSIPWVFIYGFSFYRFKSAWKHLGIEID